MLASLVMTLLYALYLIYSLVCKQTYIILFAMFEFNQSKFVNSIWSNSLSILSLCKQAALHITIISEIEETLQKKNTLCHYNALLSLKSFNREVRSGFGYIKWYSSVFSSNNLNLFIMIIQGGRLIYFPMSNFLIPDKYDS